MLEELRRVDNRCDGLWEQLQSARISLEDVALSLREYSSKIEVNPQRLEWVENRIAEITHDAAQVALVGDVHLHLERPNAQVGAHIPTGEGRTAFMEKRKPVLKGR